MPDPKEGSLLWNQGVRYEYAHCFTGSENDLLNFQHWLTWSRSFISKYSNLLHLVTFLPQINESSTNEIVNAGFMLYLVNYKY